MFSIKNGVELGARKKKVPYPPFPFLEYITKTFIINTDTKKASFDQLITLIYINLNVLNKKKWSLELKKSR